MTPHDVIRGVLERVMDIHDAHDAADEILERLAAQAFVVVHASAVIQQEGKVNVTRRLVQDVLVDAEWWVRSNYVVYGQVHPAMQRRYERDMEDIRALAAELREAPNA